VEDLFSTPTANVDPPKLTAHSPKEKAYQLSKTLDSKFVEMNTALTGMDSSMQSFVKKLADIHFTMENSIPESLHNSVKDALTNHKKRVLETLESLESRLKHCSTAIDSLHVKSNVLDTHLKSMSSSHSECSTKIDSMAQKIEQLCERNEYLDDKITQLLQKLEDGVETHRKGPQAERINMSLYTSDAADSENLNPCRNCDYLILSDSILRRIIPQRFTPKANTIKRFIRGGATTCTDFIKKYGTAFNPKNVILHVGTRDLQKNVMDSTEFTTLVETCNSTWSNAVIYISPIMTRRDMPDECVNEANQQIKSATEQCGVKIIDQFMPTESMFHDDVHLNNAGLASMVRHLKTALGLSKAAPRTPTRVNHQTSVIKRKNTQPPPTVPNSQMQSVKQDSNNSLAYPPYYPHCRPSVQGIPPNLFYPPSVPPPWFLGPNNPFAYPPMCPPKSWNPPLPEAWPTPNHNSSSRSF
jgi:FtsZ-binding cell division protein ZapB